MGQTWVAIYAGVTERRVLVPPEREHGLVHLLGVEHLEPYKQVEVLHRQAGDSEAPVELGDTCNVLQTSGSPIHRQAW